MQGGCWASGGVAGVAFDKLEELGNERQFPASARAAEPIVVAGLR